jgi:hypothetical protein
MTGTLWNPVTGTKNPIEPGEQGSEQGSNSVPGQHCWGGFILLSACMYGRSTFDPTVIADIRDHGGYPSEEHHNRDSENRPWFIFLPARTARKQAT